MKFLIHFSLLVFISFLGLTQAGCPHGFAEKFVAKHNEYRKHHGAQPLHLEGAISHWAQEWANHLATSGKFEHRPNNKYGENLWMISGSAGALHPHGDVPVASWYAEGSKYHWLGKEPNMASFHEWGHFTQVIWRGSHKVGVGCGAHGNRFVVVGNYEGHGNVVGHFHENVR